MDSIRVPNKILSDLLIGSSNKDVRILLDYLQMANLIDSNQVNLTREILLRHFIPSFEKRWRCAFYNTDKFYKLNSEWLLSDSIISLDTTKVGRRCAKLLTIWKNENPGSTRLCRLLMFEHVPETKERTTKEVELMEAKIKKLKPTKVKVPNSRCTITIFHEFALTMVDGKVCQALSGTPSAATCYICGAKPSQMNDLAKLIEKTENVRNFKYGLSTLHAWIRLMELILHISYRLGFCKWQAKTDEEKVKMKTAKQRVQKEFREKMGLIIDVPKHGSGTSNTGNTARRFFRDPDLTSEITNVDRELIRRFGIILQAMASGESIDTFKFGKYCQQTAEMYVNLYNWYYMPATAHKILIHGAKIIESAFLLIGQLTEEAQEANNKIFKHLREFHTRKCSKEATNIDLGRKLLISTDPKIVNQRQKWKKKVTLLDSEAQDLLKV